MSFQTGPEDNHGKREGDVFRQNVPDMRLEKLGRPPTVDRRVRQTISDEDELKRSR